MDEVRLLCGDCRDVLTTIDSESVDCVVTSPPYWGLRDYGVGGQLGHEPTVRGYVESLVAIIREVRRVLRDDGTLWLNLGDTYVSHNLRGTGGRSKKQDSNHGSWFRICVDTELPKKNLCGIPWRVALALQDDGWILRSDIIWAKPNPMPESVRDRPTRSHEHLFLLAKSPRYYYDADAIAEPAKYAGDKVGPASPHVLESLGRYGSVRSGFAKHLTVKQKRNKRDVWFVPVRPLGDTHFATFPENLIEPCILAGSRPGGIVLDPFVGSGTTGVVALRHGRRFIGIDINEEYIRLAAKRIDTHAAQTNMESLLTERG